MIEYARGPGRKSVPLRCCYSRLVTAVLPTIAAMYPLLKSEDAGDGRSDHMSGYCQGPPGGRLRRAGAGARRRVVHRTLRLLRLPCWSRLIPSMRYSSAVYAGCVTLLCPCITSGRGALYMLIALLLPCALCQEYRAHEPRPVHHHMSNAGPVHVTLLRAVGFLDGTPTWRGWSVRPPPCHR
jgi:hypothetical protein